METKFNFNSQVATSRSQSERLLSLGLKKETADMHHYKWSENYFDTQACPPRRDSPRYIPAWSLHRLLSLYDLHYIEFMNYEEIESVYDIVIDAIEQAIEEEYFNKDYLV